MSFGKVRDVFWTSKSMVTCLTNVNGAKQYIGARGVNASIILGEFHPISLVSPLNLALELGRVM